MKKSIFCLQDDRYEQVTEFRVLSAIIVANENTGEINDLDFKDIELYTRHRVKQYFDLVNKLFHSTHIPESLFYEGETLVYSWDRLNNILFMKENESLDEMRERVRNDLAQLKKDIKAAGLDGRYRVEAKRPKQWPEGLKIPNIID
jgi:hypothetical protein